MPPGFHLKLTPFELKLLVVRIMDFKGELDEEDARILRTPIIGKAFVASNGDIESAYERVLIDSLPGASLLRLL